MRPNQNQNQKRSRGRGGRRPTNMLNRSMDSNGPDVKVRGTPSHIHDKYITLARDANSAGDRIAAENYLQHAEHYHRLMAAAQAAVQARQQNSDEQRSGDQQQRAQGEGGADQANGQDHNAETRFDNRQERQQGSESGDGEPRRQPRRRNPRNGRGPARENDDARSVSVNAASSAEGNNPAEQSAPAPEVVEIKVQEASAPEPAAAVKEAPAEAPKEAVAETTSEAEAPEPEKKPRRRRVAKPAEATEASDTTDTDGAAA